MHEKKDNVVNNTQEFNYKITKQIKNLWELIRNHPVKTGYIILSLIFAFLIIPFFVQWLTVTESPFNNPNSANNDWISFWGGYIGTIISMIAIILTIRFESYRWKKQNLIERLPFIVAYKQRDGNISTVRPSIEICNIDFEYKLTDKIENGFENKEIGIVIENISKNYALNMKMVSKNIPPEKKEDKLENFLNSKSKNVFSPTEIMYCNINIKYNKEALLKLESPYTMFNKTFIFEICYNTPFDELLNNANTRRENKFNIYVMLFINIDDSNNVDIYDYLVSTTRIILD